MYDRTLENFGGDRTLLSKQEILNLDKNAKISEEGESTLAGKNGYRVVYTKKRRSRVKKVGCLDDIILLRQLSDYGDSINQR